MFIFREKVCPSAALALQSSLEPMRHVLQEIDMPVDQSSAEFGNAVLRQVGK
jgi:hypothetical protein